jgi:hypothetical protein
MTNRTLAKFPHASNLTRNDKLQEKVRTVSRLSRLSSIMEPLESRTMMSVAHAPVPAVKAPIKVKAALTLAVPSIVKAAASAPNKVTVSWTEEASTATGYKILRSAGGDPSAQVAQTTSASTLSYTDTQVVANVTYVYTIEAYNKTGVSSTSASVTVKTPLVSPATLTAAAASGTSIVLQWADVDGDATGYQVYRSTDGTHYSAYATLSGATVATYTDTAVTSGKAFFYEVQAISSSNSSAVSGSAKAITPLQAPTGLSDSFQSSSIINLTWTDNDANATGYTVERSTNGTSFSKLASIIGLNASTYSDKTAKPLTHYYYEVQATNSVALSPVSGIASATTPMAIPTALAATAPSPTSVKLTWTDSDASAQGYIILKATGNGSFSQATVITSGKTTVWTDNSVSMDTAYSYKIEAYNGTTDSTASAVAAVTTPMSAPISLSATVNSATSVTLNWTDTDGTATSYVIMRAVNGGSFQTLTTVSGATTATYTDTSALSGHSYNYGVLAASSGTRTSAMSTLAIASTPLATPTELHATSTIGTSVLLTWTNNDTSATGYAILRSTDGTNFTALKTVSGGTTTTTTDTTTGSAKIYYYRIEATDSYSTSAASSSAQVTTPLLAPASLATTLVGSRINLNWTDKDAVASGYVILRSTDGVNLTTLATLTSATANSYADSTASAGQKYYYQVQATSATLSSPVSNTASATAAAAPATNGVTIATRNTNELVITASGKTDGVSVTQSGSTLTIVADGQTSTQAAPSEGLFIYTRGGTDSINVDQSVTVRTTVETIDASVDDINTEGSNVSVWDDSTDIYVGDGNVHTVATFAGGVAKTTGASLADPKDAGKTAKVTGSLWGTGPVANDVNQGAAGDCYFLSSLAAFATEQPSLLQESAVDMGDGTYTVQFISNGTPKFVRVSNDISVYSNGSDVYDRPGASGNLWSAIMEKAFAYFRTGANTYSSISSGWMGEAYADLGVNSTYFMMSSTTATAFYNTVSTALSNNKEVTFGTPDSPPDLVGDHAYTLISATMVNNVATYVVRNPWGVQGRSIEDGNGYATLTFAQMQSNFIDCCVAV